MLINGAVYNLWDLRVPADWSPIPIPNGVLQILIAPNGDLITLASDGTVYDNSNPALGDRWQIDRNWRKRDSLRQQ